MKIAYICSPYRADDPATIRRNVNYAKELTRRAIKNYYAPITPHLYLTQALDDNDANERNVGLAAGIELLKKCDVLIVGNKYGISDGMRAEILEADALGLSIELVAD